MTKLVDITTSEDCWTDVDWPEIKPGVKDVSPAESQKGINTVQPCSIENQKGAIAI